MPLAGTLTQVAKKLGRTISKNSPTILTGLAVGGLCTTVIFAVKATPKAMALIEEETQRREDSTPLTSIEVIKTAWPVYIPAICMGVVTIVCIIGSNSINRKRSAALATIYGLTETAFREYKEKVAETIGKSKELKIRDDISEDHVKRNPPKDETIIFTGKGEVLCYDSLSGRYFKSDIEHIRRAVNELNKDLLNEMFINLNELYFAIGLANTTLGDQLGWDVDNGLLEISFSTQLTEHGEPCLVLNYEATPRFYKGH